MIMTVQLANRKVEVMGIRLEILANDLKDEYKVNYYKDMGRR